MRPGSAVRLAREQRFALLAAVTVAGFVLVAVGLVRLQVAEHAEWRELAKENRVRLEVLRAPRGSIYDRNGELLADSAPSFSIVFRPFPAESAHRTREIRESGWVDHVASVLGVDTSLVRQRMNQANRNGQTAVMLRNAPFEVLAVVEETRGELPGIEVQVEPLRHYPNGRLAAHLLGYAGEINARELEERKEKGYRSGDLIGRSGVERAYEERLRGVDGAEYVVVNAMGRRVSTLTEGPPLRPVAGHDLVLTIDLDIQRAMEEAMAGVERGAGIAIDPRDGGVLAVVSRPTFDPNEFSRGLSFARWRAMSAGGAEPLLNRALQGVYPPGSTFKIITMLAAMREGVADPHHRMPVSCAGGYQFGGRFFGCWKREGHGSLDLTGALEHSCDTYFYQTGLKLGLPHLAQAARDFGLGARTGVDLPQEGRGLMPDPAWYDRRFGVGRWPRGVLLNLAIGQGEILATPLQLAIMAAQATNAGKPVRPHVVREVRGDDAFVVPPPQHAGIRGTPEQWDAVREAMRRVVETGTARAARIPGIAVGGKTGTAQNPHGDDHALFVAVAPLEAPRIAMAFVIENSGHGGSVAAPMAGHVMRRMFLPDSLQYPMGGRPPGRAPARRDTVPSEEGAVARAE